MLQYTVGRDFFSDLTVGRMYILRNVIRGTATHTHNTLEEASYSRSQSLRGGKGIQHTITIYRTVSTWLLAITFDLLPATLITCSRNPSSFLYGKDLLSLL